MFESNYSNIVETIVRFEVCPSQHGQIAGVRAVQKVLVSISNGYGMAV